MHISDHRVLLPDGALFVRSWLPEGPAPERAILLFHDSLGCVELWRDFPRQLAKATGRRVLAYDRLGFGRSYPHPDKLPLDFIQQEARVVVPAICTALALTRIVPFGHSVGGGMAVATAGAWPDLCEAVVTVAAQAFVEDRTIAGIEDAKAAFASPEQFARLARYHGESARWVLGAWTETWLSPAFAGWTLDQALRSVRCPLLAIHGDRDEYGSLAHPERIAMLAGGGGTAAIIADCGHVPHKEHAPQVLAHIQTFLVRSTEAGGL